MSKLNDALLVMTGRDFEEEPLKRIKKGVKKPGQKRRKADPEPEWDDLDKKPAKKKDNRKPVSTDDAKFAAYDYANDKDKLSEDVRLALKEGSLSDDLSRLLQVLFDRKSVRELVSAQGDVCPPPPGPDDYYLDFRYVHPDTGDWCNEQAEALLQSGMTLDDLSKFNMELKVVRKRKLDDEELQEGTDEDYAEIRAKIEEKQSDTK